MKSLLSKWLIGYKPVPQKDTVRKITFNTPEPPPPTNLDTNHAIISENSHPIQEKKGDINQMEDSEEDQFIINCLVRMSDTLKLTKNNRDLRGQYVTLRHINRLLCQEHICVTKLAQLLITKSETEHKTNPKLESQAKKTSFVQYYTSNSNGLIYQYYSIRALLWKVVLGYLPTSKNKWISFMQGNLLKYQEFVDEFIVENIKKKNAKKEANSAPEKKIVDHPLNREKASKWNSYFQDYELWQTIEKDIIRTRSDCKFFQEPFEMQLSGDHGQEKIRGNDLHLSKNKGKKETYYYDSLTRILFVYLKNHGQVAYCQGMNELVSLIFYGLTNKNSEYFRRVSESDTYFCFEIIMHLLGPNPFLNGEKHSKQFQELLRKVDFRLYECLLSTKLLDQLKMVSLRWFNAWFLCQFPIDDSLILWDSFIAIASVQNSFKQYQNSFTFTARLTMPDMMLYIGLAIVHLSRNDLYEGRRPMELFAKITQSPIVILDKAVNLYKIFHRRE